MQMSKSPIISGYDKYDPSNYRGISITSNLGKRFNKIIHARLLKFIGSNNLICENQIGFKKIAELLTIFSRLNH
jgi:hypothetical protein